MPSLPPWKTKALPLDMNLSLRYSCTDAWTFKEDVRHRRKRRRWSNIVNPISRRDLKQRRKVMTEEVSEKTSEMCQMGRSIGRLLKIAP